MNHYWQYQTEDGWCFCWRKEPSFECPWSRLPPILEASRPTMPPEIVQAAGTLGMEVEKLYALIRRASHGGRARVGGVLTNRCHACGAKMKRLGFRCWIERPAAEATAWAEAQTGDRLGRVLFGTPAMPVKSLYLPTKKEAQAWALEERRTHQLILKEGAIDET